MNFNSLFNISNNSLKFRNGFLKCQIVIAVSIKASADRYVLTEQFSILKEYMKPPHDICNNICITVTKSNLPSLKILGLLKSYEEWKWKIFFHITQDFSQIKLCVCVCVIMLSLIFLFFYSLLFLLLGYELLKGQGQIC